MIENKLIKIEETQRYSNSLTVLSAALILSERPPSFGFEGLTMLTAFELHPSIYSSNLEIIVKTSENANFSYLLSYSPCRISYKFVSFHHLAERCHIQELKVSSVFVDFTFFQEVNLLAFG